MSEVAKDREPKLTEVQQRFLGFVAAHVHSEDSHEPGTKLSQQGVYCIVDDQQLLPFGDIIFTHKTKQVRGQDEIEASIAYEDTEGDFLVEVALEVDGKGQAVDVCDGEPDKAFFINYASCHTWKESDAFAVQFIDRFERLEATGAIVQKPE